MKLALKVIGGSQMNIKIETKPSFKVAGVLKENIDSNQCPSTWDELYSKYSFEQLESFGNGQSLGVCYENEEMIRLIIWRVITSWMTLKLEI